MQLRLREHRGSVICNGMIETVGLNDPVAHPRPPPMRREYGPMGLFHYPRCVSAHHEQEQQNQPLATCAVYIQPQQSQHDHDQHRDNLQLGSLLTMQ